jgi:hypothetical protein
MGRADAEPPVPTVGRGGRPSSPTRTKPVRLQRCRRHGVVEFGLYGRKSPRWSCKRCVADAVTRRHQKQRRILIEEAGGRCAVCGYHRCLYNLHFHHVDPSTKELEMTMAAGRSLAAYRAEARKCVLVCANCHGEIETGLIPSPPPGARYGEAWEPVIRPVPVITEPDAEVPPDQLTLLPEG